MIMIFILCDINMMMKDMSREALAQGTVFRPQQKGRNH